MLCKVQFIVQYCVNLVMCSVIDVTLSSQWYKALYFAILHVRILQLTLKSFPLLQSWSLLMSCMKILV